MREHDFMKTARQSLSGMSVRLHGAFNKYREAQKKAQEDKKREELKKLLTERQYWIKQALPCMIRELEKEYNFNNFSEKITVPMIQDGDSSIYDNTIEVSYHVYYTPTLDSYNKVDGLVEFLNRCKKPVLCDIEGLTMFYQDDINRLLIDVQKIKAKAIRLNPNDIADLAQYQSYCQQVHEMELEIQHLQNKILYLKSAYSYFAKSRVVATQHLKRSERIVIKLVN